MPEMKGKPGKIALWSYPASDTPVASRSSFRAQVGTKAIALARIYSGVC